MSLGVGALQVGGARKVSLEEEGGHHLKRHCHTEEISRILANQILTKKGGRARKAKFACKNGRASRQAIKQKQMPP